MSEITLMTTDQMQVLAYALGIGLLTVAVVNICRSLQTKKSTRTYGASLDTDY